MIGGYNVIFHYPAITPEITAFTFNQLYTPLGYGTVRPKISLASPENGNYTHGNITLIFTLNKATSWMGYNLDGQDNITISGNTTIANLPQSLHNVTVYANDTLGNTGKSETITFNIVAEPKPFPTALVTAVLGVLAAAVVGIGLIVYFRKRRPTTPRDTSS